MNSMNSWLYLKGDRFIDICALSMALDYLGKEWNIVRSTSITPFFINHPNVGKIGHPLKDEPVLKVEVDGVDTLRGKINVIVNQLSGEDVCDGYEVKARWHAPSSSIVADKLIDQKCAILFLQDNMCRFVDLMFIDEVCGLLLSRNLTVASLGDLTIPCIRGTLDYRGLIADSELVSLIDRVPFVLTNSDNISELCKSLGKPSFDIRFEEGVVLCNDIEIYSPTQVANMILKTTAYGQK